MALYKNKDFFEWVDDKAFDQLTSGGNAAPWPGIYRCIVCGHEIAIAGGHILPAQNHSQHPAGKPIHWQLIASHKRF